MSKEGTAMPDASPGKSASSPSSIGDFTVEFCIPLCRSGMLRCLGPKAIRGRYSNALLINENHGMQDVGRQMMSCPEIPGAYIEVSLKSKRGKIYDPKENDDEFWSRVNEVVKQNNGPFRPTPIDLKDPDLAKTLMLELCGWREAKKLAVIKGEFPDRSQIESLPGRQLWDPADTHPRHPKYRDQYNEWADRIEMAAKL